MHNLYYNCREISCYFNARLLQSTAPHTHTQTYISYWDYGWSIPLPCMLILIALKLNVNNDLKPNKWFSIKWTVQDICIHLYNVQLLCRKKDKWNKTHSGSQHNNSSSMKRLAWKVIFNLKWSVEQLAQLKFIHCWSMLRCAVRWTV